MTSTEAGHHASLARAEILCDMGRFTDAERMVQNVLAHQPQDLGAWCLLARAQIGNSDFVAALRSADTAAALAPDSEWPHRLRSIALLRTDQPGPAVEAARTAVRVAPHTWQTYRCLADALAATKQTAKEAIEVALHAVALAPHAPEAHFALGAAQAATGRRDQARVSFGNVLALDPQHSAAHHELARLHLTQRLPTGPKDLADAASGFATALRADPGATPARLNLDLVLRSFLARLSYLIFLAALLPRQLNLFSADILGRALPVVLLALPACFAVRFVRRLTPTLRDHLVALVTGPSFAVAAAAEALATLALTVTAVVPAGARPPIEILAVASAIAGRLALERETHETIQKASDQPRKPWISNSVLWVLAVALLLVAAMAFLSAPTSGAVASCVLAGVVSGAAGAFTIRAIMGRK